MHFHSRAGESAGKTEKGLRRRTSECVKGSGIGKSSKLNNEFYNPKSCHHTLGKANVK